MKRLRLCIFFLAIVFVVTGSAQTKSEAEATGSVRELCYKLWKSTNFGFNDKQAERAAWILRDNDGRYRWQEWDNREEHNAATWKRPVPDGVVALIHTHPAFGNPKPSKQDMLVAKRIKAPVYTVSAF